MYETHDDLTADQAAKFIEIFSDKVGTDYELNASPSGKPNQFYVVCFELEEISEYDACNKAEEDCRKVN
jgi:hypothetical protein